MNKLYLIVGLIGAVILLSLFFLPSGNNNPLGTSLRVCTVTQGTIQIGNLASTEILSAGNRAWVIVQQPVNATNTVAISLDGTTAQISEGYHLGDAWATTTPSEFRMGFGTDITNQNSLNAITNLGSTTVNVISCR